MASDWVRTVVGYLLVFVLAVGGVFVVGTMASMAVNMGADTSNGVHVESYPVGPEKPTPVNSSNVVDYTATYEERLFYNDLLASHDHVIESDERVIAACTPLSVSNATSGGFDVRLECRGGVTDSSQLSDSEASTYSVSYRITETTTQQTDLENYPFETDGERRFNDETASQQ